MTAFSAGRPNDGIILVARILLVALFLVFGWDKLTNYSGALAYMAQVGAPVPALAALVAIVMEVVVAFGLAVGLWTGPLALLLAVYTLGTGIIGHPFWAGEGAARYMDAINFYKNISIIGGCLLLYVTGPGRHSVDARLGQLGTNLGTGAARG
ncbi:DoxX family protein (plasmid) [Microvirga terrae]|uniref:DoxX family protein n=1 Tax=Microvirga terrae TaxID=2740529 RepID=A0ABY5RZU2_9HYPH|nr:DoxX family protein [Microvirga terrae]UVF22750.1 DoxX family protein [Microvirga terrae]